jgi:nucleoside-diphosphate-sugar epimerase
MKVMVAGASGAIGIPLTRQLIASGHQVLGLTRDQGGGRRRLEALGATPVVADALDRDELLRAVDGRRADAVIHELTALRKPPRRHRGMAMTNRLRTEGTANLLAAAQALGARRFLTQSIVFGYGYRDHGDRILTEDAPFGRPAGNRSDPHVAAMLSTEQQAFSAPRGSPCATACCTAGDAAQMRALLARRGLPVATGGVLGWIHHQDAAAATVAALEHGRPGQAYNLVDDLPATWREVYSAMARAFGTAPPRRLPRWVFRLVAPYVASFAVDTSIRAANTRARAELGWHPAYATYHEGIAAMVSAPAGREPHRV